MKQKSTFYTFFFLWQYLAQFVHAVLNLSKIELLKIKLFIFVILHYEYQFHWVIISNK